MKRTLAAISFAAVLAITAFAQSYTTSVKAAYCASCCHGQCGLSCCQHGCTDNCCNSK